MHIVIAGLYATIIWLSLLAYTVILHGWWLVVIIAGPIIISALIIGLIGLDILVDRIAKRWFPAKPPDKEPETAATA